MMRSLMILLAFHVSALAAPLTLQLAAHTGFDILLGGKVVAPIRFSGNGAILAQHASASDGAWRFTGLHCIDPAAVGFAPDDFVTVALGPRTIVEFKVTFTRFDPDRWQKLFGAAAPFHFLTCSMPSAKMWHQRGWLNATPNDDPFPLLGDQHAGTPEISSLWNRNWSYLCPLGAHPIPMVGLWNPESRLYVGYDFQDARVTDQSARNIATAYCWREVNDRSFITLAYPFGGLRYGELLFPKAGQAIHSHFELIVDTNLPSTEDPNERFQQRLFSRPEYRRALPSVPAMNDLAWIPGAGHLEDFPGPISLDLFGPGGEQTFYADGTLLCSSWEGHREMPIDTAVRQSNTAAIEQARARLQLLLDRYARHFTVDGDRCLFWTKPLEGSWRPQWGGTGVTSLHNSDGWYPARVLVELYRYDRSRHQARPSDLAAIDQLFNWAKDGVWSRNEFPDVPSSPFAIGASLRAAFLLDYYFTFRDDATRSADARFALHLADNTIWRYLAIWAMDSDRFDDAVDGSFLMEPNSGRDWAGLGCANEASWVIDALTQVYVHTGDARMRYYLRGLLQRWPILYRPLYESSLADYDGKSLTEGYGIYDGSGPGKGERYGYGFVTPLSLEEPIGASRMRVVAGVATCIAFDKGSTDKDVSDYRTDGQGGCSFRIVASPNEKFDVSFSYPNVNISSLPVTLTRNGQTRSLSETEARHPRQAPSSIYFAQLQANDVITIGDSSSQKAASISVEPIPSGPPQTIGAYRIQPIPSEQPLSQDWSDAHSFAGLIPGLRWAYGVPYWQSESAATNPVPAHVPNGAEIFVIYSPISNAAPRCISSDGKSVPLRGQPALAWRGWPPIFDRQILIDSLAASSNIRAIDPAGALIMAVTVGPAIDPAIAAACQTLASNAIDLASQERERAALAQFREALAHWPAGKIALLPDADSGAGENFAYQTGLNRKWTRLAHRDLISPAKFSASQFPIALYLGGETYRQSIESPGDADAALERYLREGGTLVCFATEPYPFYYVDSEHHSDPLFPKLGLPLSLESPSHPEQLLVRPAAAQSIVPAAPASYPFPQTDPRLRAGNAAAINPGDAYTPLLSVFDPSGQSLGDAAFDVRLKTGPGRGGRIIYIWSSLLNAPEGNTLMSEVLAGILQSR